ncbi:MAG: 16S rRNA processing protein RimM [Duodenibacillus sp.]|nr:16S rRNA processing protein RimM [Duodenibacillus sp.]
MTEHDEANIPEEEAAPEDDWVEVGRTGGAWGVRGWLHAVPWETGLALESAGTWRIRLPSGEAREYAVEGFKVHGNGPVAKLAGIDDKEAADALRGRIEVRRCDFPELGEGENWAVDLIGCRVVNLQGVALGTVEDLGDNGVQDILKVVRTAGDGGEALYLIPVVEAYVTDIDLGAGIITVDWQPDWV